MSERLDDYRREVSDRIEVRRGPWAVTFPATIDSAWLAAALGLLQAQTGRVRRIGIHA